MKAPNIAPSTRRRYLIVTLFLIATISSAVAEARDYEAVRSVARTVELSDGSLEIDHRFGELRVRAHDRPNVVVNGTIQVSLSTSQEDADRLVREIEVTVETRRSGVRIVSKFPEANDSPWYKKFFGVNHSKNLSWNVDLEVVMPADAPLVSANRFGETWVEGVRAGSEIRNEHGALYVKQTEGSQRLENKFGKIEIVQNRGDLVVRGANGPVSVKEVTGSVYVSNRFGDIKVTGVGGKLEIEAANSTVEIEDIGGPVKARNSFGAVVAKRVRGSLNVDNSNGKVSATNIEGDARLGTSFSSIYFRDIRNDLVCLATNSQIEGSGVGGHLDVENTFGKVVIKDVGNGAAITNRNGSVSLRDVTGDAEVTGSFAMVTTERISGALTVENSNGGIRATDVARTIRLETSFAPIFAKGIGEEIRVVNKNGSITIAEIRSAERCQPISLEGSFGSIKVSLAEGVNYDLEASTSFGRIETDFPVTVSGEISTKRLSGTIGSGGCRLEIRNQNGGVSIRKE